MTTMGDSADAARWELISQLIISKDTAKSTEVVYMDDKLIRIRYIDTSSGKIFLTVIKYFADGAILAKLEQKDAG